MIKAIILSILLGILFPLLGFDISLAQKVTYRLNITNTDGSKGYATAVAVSEDGKLVTAYHNIEKVQTVIAQNFNGKSFKVHIGTISKQNDLAYLYMDIKGVEYVKQIQSIPALGEKIYVINSDNLLLEGIISKVMKEKIIFNFEISKGTSGSGIFDDNNNLIGIALGRDRLDKTSYGSPVNIFSNISRTYSPLKRLNSTNNYDDSYCYDKDELVIWEKYAKSPRLEIQELHALFLGLCEKVKRHDLTTEEAQFIFEKSRSELLR